MRKSTVFLTWIILFALPVFGQTFGQISGLVTDASGSVVVGANVSVTNPQTNFSRSTSSNSVGNYNFPDLQPGLYNVKVEMPGFQGEIRSGIELQVQQTARIDFQLSVGGVSQTVEVQAGAALLNTENATVGAVIEEKRIEDLPLNGRSFISLMSLTPNVVTGQSSTGGLAQTRGGSDRGNVSISVAGLRREFNFYTLDGVSNTDVDFVTYAFLPSIDALQEFKVQTGVYSAEFGHEAAQVNVSTKSGTNSYHGSVFEFLRNNALDARPYGFTTSVPQSAPFKWNQFGFTLGGPVQIPKLFNGKDRLFFMSNYEGFRFRNQTQVVDSVPTAAMRGGNFSQILPTTVIKDFTNNNQPFPGNIIPTQRLNPISLGLLPYLPLPNIPGTGLVNNYLELDNGASNRDQFTQRIDFIESQKSSWFGRFSWQDESKVTPGLNQNFAVTDEVKNVVLSNTRILTPALVNEFRFGWLGYHNILTTLNGFKNNVTGDLNIPLLSVVAPIAWGVPTIQIQGFSIFGDNTQGPWAVNDHTFQWIDNMSWTHGNHSIRYGAEIRRDRYNDTGNQNIRGQYQFQNQATGYGFGDYLLGYFNNLTDAAALANMQMRATSQAYFVNDNWKILPNLTIEAGLRWEYTPPWSSRSDSLINGFVGPAAGVFTPNAPANLHPYEARNCAAYGQSSFYPPETNIQFADVIQTKCVTGPGTTLIRKDLIDWAPRLGLAWSPTPKWTVRAGFGIFYVQDQGNVFLDLARNFSGKTSNTANTTTHNLSFQNPFTSGASACTNLPAGDACVTLPLMYSVDGNRRNAYVAQYLLNIQRQLTNSMVLEVGYLGSQSHRLGIHMSYDDLVLGAGSVASRSPFPEFSGLQDIMSIAKSNYESGTVKLTQRLTKGLSLLASYTLSKSMDDNSGINPANGNVTANREPQTGYCLACEYALSDFDTRQRFVVSVLYELPFGRGKQFLNHGIAGSVLGGWQLNSIITKSTGFPVTVYDGVNQSNSNVNADRPNATGISPTLSNPTTAEWFNTQAFVLQPKFTFGNVGRNVFTSPGIASWDFSVLKNFYFRERSYVQFRFECFNCANHPNFADPGQTLSSNQLTAAGAAIPGTGSFGVITNTRPGIDMRELQFSLKLVF